MNDAERIDWDMLSDLVYLQFLLMERHDAAIKADAVGVARDQEGEAVMRWGTTMILVCCALAAAGASIWTMILGMALGATGVAIRMRRFLITSEKYSEAIRQSNAAKMRLSAYGH